MIRFFCWLTFFFFLLGCSGKQIVKNSYIFKEKKKIYFNLVLNQSSTSRVEDNLIIKLRDYFSQSSQFILVNIFSEADYVITIYIDEFKLNLGTTRINQNYFKGTIVLDDRKFNPKNEVRSNYIVFYDEPSTDRFNQPSDLADREVAIGSLFDNFTDKLERWLIYKLL